MTHHIQDNTGGDAAAPAMTDADIEAMVADRAAGTKGPWRVVKSEITEGDCCKAIYVDDYGILGYWTGHKSRHDGQNWWLLRDPDANRIARVPEMEQTILTLRAELADARADAAGYHDAYEGEKYGRAADAIRAIPLPTNADLLAEAMKLPEVVALVEAIAECQAALADFSNMYPQMVKGFMVDAENSAIAAIAPFTAAKATT